MYRRTLSINTKIDACHRFSKTIRNLKKYIPYAAIVVLLLFITFDKCNLSEKLNNVIDAASDLPNCSKTTITVFDTEIQSADIEVPLTYEITQDAYVRAPEMNKAQQLWRDTECGFGRNVPFLVIARVKNTGNLKGIFRMEIEVEMNNSTSSKTMVLSRELDAGEEGLFTSQEFEAKCTPEPIVKNSIVEAPTVKQRGQEKVKIPRNIEAQVLEVKKERTNIILRNRPSFDQSAETENRANGGDIFVYLEEKADKMTWTTKAGEYLEGQFLKVRAIKEPAAFWIFSPFVECK